MTRRKNCSKCGHEIFVCHTADWFVRDEKKVEILYCGEEDCNCERRISGQVREGK